MDTAERDNRKCFGQLCTVARALDIVGDRWTLLILRELLGGPARFFELQTGLPGIAKNLLSDRLRRLEGDGLVRRVSSGASTRYALTDLGSAIRPVVEALGIWGARAPKLAPPVHDRSVRSIAMALQTFLTRASDAMPAQRTVVELGIDGEPLEIVLGEEATATARPSDVANARLETTMTAMTDYLHGVTLDKAAFKLTSGDETARAALLRAMARLL